MKPRRLQSATTSSRVGPSAVASASFTRGTVPGGRRRLLRLELELGLVAPGVLDDDRERLADLALHPDRPVGEATLDGGGALTARLQLQRPLRGLRLHLLAVAGHGRAPLEGLALREGDALRRLQRRRLDRL